MMSVIGFLIILGPLVIVHELGHFLFAKLFNVKAEAFSVGFGPRIFAKQWGETEWRLSAIPLGGYVKLLGEDREAPLSEAELARALHKQAPWKRFFIFFGGPLFNFLFAILIFMAIFALGEKQVASRIGRVVPQSLADQVGMKSGDQILSINQSPVTRFEEVAHILNESPGKEIEFLVAREEGATRVEKTIRVTPTREKGMSQYGEQTWVGEVDGMFPMARSTQIGVSDPQSAAGRAGIRTGEWIKSIQGRPVSDWETVEKIYSELKANESFSLEVAPQKNLKDSRTLTLSRPAGKGSSALAGGFSPLASELGIHSSELFVDRVLPDSPAEKAGLKKGDRLVEVGTGQLASFYQLKQRVQSGGEKDGQVAMAWERDGKITRATLVPTGTEGKDVLLNRVVTYTVGVAPLLAFAEPVYVVERIWNPFTLLYRGTERMISLTAKNFISIGKMLSGSVSSTSLGGPITIGIIAGESLALGLIAVLTTMGILSIGLGVLNILPVPVLDGGHILLLGIEAIRGKPLTLRQMEVVQSLGLGLILMLMVLVFKNDITRLIS